jgi:hypothetical protein
MAHFAKLDNENKVIQVVVIANNDILDSNKNESEQVGIQFCKTLFGVDTNWKQTSYNSSIRKHYAGIGSIYDSVRDAFIPPKTFQSWVLDENTCDWIAPIPYPTDGKDYKWDEPTLTWIERP